MLLALVPLGAALVLGLLLAPRSARPEDVPLPLPDSRELARVAENDRALAERAHRQALPGAVRALGSAIRDFHSLEAHAAEKRELGPARRRVDETLIDALGAGEEPLLELRAAQLDGFVEEVRRFEATGEESAELRALAGGFVRTMTAEGWRDGRRLLPRGAELHAMFKEMWNTFLGLEHRPSFEPTRDERRALYAFYLSHAHPTKAMRDALAAARRGAGDAKACEAIAEAERVATETWRLDHVKSVAAFDPSYPADYALGVAAYRRGDYGASVAAFRRWLSNHPQGPLALRAQNYVRAAAEADRSE
jgi:TolA-binding protein